MSNNKAGRFTQIWLSLNFHPPWEMVYTNTCYKHDRLTDQDEVR
ncbi:uncharacterized protein METZ01_LOCUS296836 [marine metagenome]|uniref:Uncharacterized protein n=1 Tax=marine metagenome TaxID=408172 RepID=A0A382M9C2_9ZZZZ